MKFLLRGKQGFLEAELKDGILEKTGKIVDPRELVHFGTDLMDLDLRNFDSGLSKQYIHKLECMNVEYLFVSEPEDVEYAQSGKKLAVVTSYLRKK
jgi:hypothetical protein